MAQSIDRSAPYNVVHNFALAQAPAAMRVASRPGGFNKLASVMCGVREIDLPVAAALLSNYKGSLVQQTKNAAASFNELCEIVGNPDVPSTIKVATHLDIPQGVDATAWNLVNVEKCGKLCEAAAIAQQGNWPKLASALIKKHDEIAIRTYDFFSAKVAYDQEARSFQVKEAGATANALWDAAKSVYANPGVRDIGKKLLGGAAVGTGLGLTAVPLAMHYGGNKAEELMDSARNKALQTAAGTAGIAVGANQLDNLLSRFTRGKEAGCASHTDNGRGVPATTSDLSNKLTGKGQKKTAAFMKLAMATLFEQLVDSKKDHNDALRNHFKIAAIHGLHELMIHTGNVLSATKVAGDDTPDSKVTLGTGLGTLGGYGAGHGLGYLLGKIPGGSANARAAAGVATLLGSTLAGGHIGKGIEGGNIGEEALRGLGHAGAAAGGLGLGAGLGHLANKMLGGRYGTLLPLLGAIGGSLTGHSVGKKHFGSGWTRENKESAFTDSNGLNKDLSSANTSMYPMGAAGQPVSGPGSGVTNAELNGAGGAITTTHAPSSGMSGTSKTSSRIEGSKDSAQHVAQQIGGPLSGLAGLSGVPGTTAGSLAPNLSTIQSTTGLGQPSMGKLDPTKLRDMGNSVASKILPDKTVGSMLGSALFGKRASKTAKIFEGDPGSAQRIAQTIGGTLGGAAGLPGLASGQLDAPFTSGLHSATGLGHAFSEMDRKDPSVLRGIGKLIASGTLTGGGHVGGHLLGSAVSDALGPDAPRSAIQALGRLGGTYGGSVLANRWLQRPEESPEELPEEAPAGIPANG